MMEPQVTLLADCKRLHLHHGPIDLIIEAFGNKDEITKSYGQAREAFKTVLVDLTQELALLRDDDVMAYMLCNGAISKRMTHAVKPHAEMFVTPMAAVAGAVADHILEAMIDGRCLDKAYVNNGGDCALYLNTGQSLGLAAVAESQSGTIHIDQSDPVRGVATSGWRGRSHSLGIADAVTVLAATAAQADVAATLIANAVNLPDHPEIKREPASLSHPDSDLKDRLVTVAVGPLTQPETDEALNRGLSLAQHMQQSGLIVDALLFLKSQTRQTTDQRILLNA